MDYLNNVAQAPKNVEQMKQVMREALASDPELSARMTELTGFPIRWMKLNVAQAYMVWLAWQTVQGDELAGQILTAIRGVEVAEREQITQEEIRALREMGAMYRHVERTARLGWRSVLPYPGDLDAAVSQLIFERNDALSALSVSQKE